ncbi:MAG TPA: ABC transporter substrate-binding protein [Burkholderiaceae bacterium]|nr:ABC transporter substrate-binding protein [Burkholderiaceae bacterium]
MSTAQAHDTWFSSAVTLATASSAQKSSLSPHRLDAIYAQSQLRVCIWPDYYSISYRDPRTFDLSGLDVDLARELGRELGVHVSFVNSSFGTLADDLLNDRCDISMFAVGITPERQEILRFTTPHLYSDVLGITTKTNKKIQTWQDIDQSDVVVSVAEGSFHELLMRERLENAQLLLGRTPQAREQDVLSGRADVFMTDFPYTRRMLELTDWARLVVPDEPYHLLYYAWAMAPGDDIWHERVQRFVDAIKTDGRLLKAAKKHQLDSAVVLD